MLSVYLPLAEQTVSVGLLVGAGIIVGIISGIFGLGGGFLITPILILYGVPAAIAAASGTAVVVASATTSVSGLRGKQAIDSKLALYLIVFGLLGSILGVWLFGWLRLFGHIDLFIELLYIILLTITGGWMFIESLLAIYYKDDKIRRLNLSVRFPFAIYFPISDLHISLIAIIFWGSLVGMLSSIMGVGGGTMLIPILIYFFHAPMRVVVGTSTMQIMCVSILSLLLQASHNHAIDPVLAFFLVLGGVVGAFYGQQLGQKINGKNLRFLFGLLVLSVAVKLAINLIMPPDNLLSVKVI